MKKINVITLKIANKVVQNNTIHIFNLIETVSIKTLILNYF